MIVPLTLCILKLAMLTRARIVTAKAHRRQPFDFLFFAFPVRTLVFRQELAG